MAVFPFTIFDKWSVSFSVIGFAKVNHLVRSYLLPLKFPDIIAPSSSNLLSILPIFRADQKGNN